MGQLSQSNSRKCLDGLRVLVLEHSVIFITQKHNQARRTLVKSFCSEEFDNIYVQLYKRKCCCSVCFVHELGHSDIVLSFIRVTVFVCWCSRYSLSRRVGSIVRLPRSFGSNICAAFWLLFLLWWCCWNSKSFRILINKTSHFIHTIYICGCFKLIKSKSKDIYCHNTFLLNAEIFQFLFKEFEKTKYHSLKLLYWVLITHVFFFGQDEMNGGANGVSQTPKSCSCAENTNSQG